MLLFLPKGNKVCDKISIFNFLKNSSYIKDFPKKKINILLNILFKRYSSKKKSVSTEKPSEYSENRKRVGT